MFTDNHLEDYLHQFAIFCFDVFFASYVSEFFIATLLQIALMDSLHLMSQNSSLPHCAKSNIGGKTYMTYRHQKKVKEGNRNKDEGYFLLQMRMCLNFLHLHYPFTA